VRVIVVDDQTVVREGLVTLLETMSGIEVVGSASDGEEAVDLVADAFPEVVLMDLRMPRMDGVEATRRIRSDHPGTQVVVLTTYADDESIVGRCGQVRSDTSPRTPAGITSPVPWKLPPQAKQYSIRRSRPDSLTWRPCPEPGPGMAHFRTD
jgi:CheY-like chemotaxis protein